MVVFLALSTSLSIFLSTSLPLHLITSLPLYLFAVQEGFKYMLKTSFEGYINQRQNKPAELLAKYVDRKMRGEKGVGEAEMETVLEKVCSLSPPFSVCVLNDGTSD